jgi:signal transduction histidine kinase
MTEILLPPPVAAVTVDARPGPRSWFWRTTKRAGTAFRLASLHAIVLAAVLTGSILALLHTTTLGVHSIAIGQLNAELQSFQQAAAKRNAGESLRQVSAHYLSSHAVPNQNLVEVAAPGQWALADAGGSAIASDTRVVALSAVIPSHTRLLERQIAGHDLEIVVSPIRSYAGPSGVFVAAVNMDQLKPAGSAAFRLALAEGAIALIAGVTSAYLLLRRLLRRIGGITMAAEHIGSDRVGERLGDQGTSDEVGQLAASFDSMLDRIESAVNAQHELLSDVSHQLRTPLTVARGHLEVLERTGITDEAEVRETVNVAIDELDRMDALIERLLQLGRAREPLSRDVHDVDLRAFCTDIVMSCRVLADRQWLLDPVPDEVVRFDETEVRGAVLNLIDNSVRATSPGDAVALSASLDHQELRLSVDDSGPGIAEADREAVLDRFARLGHRPPGGAGLGLAIASAVCAGHGGRVEIGDSPLGGARVTLVIERSAPCASY